MFKVIKQNNNLKHAIILSIALHFILIAILIWRSINQPLESSMDSRSYINALIVDPYTMVQQYDHQKQTDEQPTLYNTEKIDQKHLIDQQRTKMLEKQYVAKHEIVKMQQQNQIEQQKQEKKLVKQTQIQHKQADIVANKAKKQIEEKLIKFTVNNNKIKAEQTIKDKTIATNQFAEQAIKQSSDIDVLLNNLTEAQNAPKSINLPVEGSKIKKNNATKEEIDNYKTQVSLAISNKFYNSSSYSGKMCDLHVKLAPDGLLISIAAVGGDPALCQAAISAAKLATIPRPPSPQVYEVFKNTTLGFFPH